MTPRKRITHRQYDALADKFRILELELAALKVQLDDADGEGVTRPFAEQIDRMQKRYGLLDYRFEPENLDDAGVEAIAAFLERAARDHNLPEVVLGLLQTYAIRRVAACSQRHLGNIEKASACEHECELLYDALPEFARW